MTKDRRPGLFCAQNKGVSIAQTRVMSPRTWVFLDGHDAVDLGAKRQSVLESESPGRDAVAVA